MQASILPLDSTIPPETATIDALNPFTLEPQKTQAFTEPHKPLYIFVKNPTDQPETLHPLSSKL